MVVRRRFSPGITLLEMMLTVALLGVLIMIAAPSIPVFTSGFQLNGATKEAAADLQFARLLAVKENRDIQVTFNSNSYQVMRVSDGSIVKSRNLGSDYPGVTLTATSMVFDSRGTFDPTKNAGANSTIITVVNSRGSKNISIVRTGRVKIE